MNLQYNFRVFLDALGLDYLPEKHCPPAYGFRTEKTANNQQEKQTGKTEENTRKIRPGFCADITEEKGNIVSAWKSKKYNQDAELTLEEIRTLNAANLSLSVARVVKTDKVLSNLSNRDIVSNRHTPGNRDGYSKGNIDKIAAIVAPSTDRG